MLSLAIYFYICWGTRSSPNQTPTVSLTTTLVIWLYYHSMEEISTLDDLLKVTVTPLHVLLTMKCSTRFMLRTVQVSY